MEEIVTRIKKWMSTREPTVSKLAEKFCMIRLQLFTSWPDGINLRFNSL